MAENKTDEQHCFAVLCDICNGIVATFKRDAAGILQQGRVIVVDAAAAKKARWCVTHTNPTSLVTPP